MPKIKIRKKSFEDYMKEEPTLDTGDGKVEMAKIPTEDLTPKKKRKGKITIRRKKGKAKENIIDARANTRDTVKDTYEKMRLEAEKNLGKRIKKIKVR